MNSLAECRRYVQLIAFNRRPSRYLHPERRVRYFGAHDIHALFANDHSHEFLSLVILQEDVLEDISDAQSRHPAVCIGIQSNCTQVGQLASRIGLILMESFIRKAIDARSVAAWADALGDCTYQFACRQASLFGGAQYIHMVSDLKKPETLIPSTSVIQLREIGFLFLRNCARLLDPAIGRRFELKLPQHFAPEAVFDIAPGFTQDVWIWIDRIWHSMPTHIFPLKDELAMPSR